MHADELAMQGSRASAATILTKFSQNIVSLAHLSLIFRIHVKSLLVAMDPFDQDLNPSMDKWLFAQ